MAADAADARAKDGKPLGPLDGTMVSIKDLYDMAGEVTRAGSRVLAGEGTPEEVVAARGLAVVSDDGALTAAVDEAIAVQPDVAQKIRDGKGAAVGALLAAVMKATRGQADATRARELILERLTQP